MAVALYARVSTVRQAEKDLSIPDQLRQMREWCKTQGYTVACEYIEPGASATDDRRPIFQQMIAEATLKSSPYEAVIVHSLSRFFRDSLEFGLYERKLNKSGVKLISITQQTSDDPAGEMARKIFSVFDEYQSKENAKHTLRAMNENARRGFFNGSRPPFGYRVVDTEAQGARGKRKKVLAIDPAESAIVQRVFDLYLNAYLGAKSIASKLNDLGLSHRGARWTRSRVHEVLCNRTYMGEFIFNRKNHRTLQVKPETEWIKVTVPPIVEPAVFDSAQARRHSRAPTMVSPRVVGSPTLLTGLLKCGHCGAGMTLATGKGGKYRYYKCNTRIGKGNHLCDCPAVPMAKLDTLVLDALAEKVFTPERLRLLLQELKAKLKAAEQDQEGQLKSLSKELEELQQGTERLYEAVEKGLLPLDGSLQERAHKLQARRQDILMELAGLRQKKAMPLNQLTAKQLNAFSMAMRTRLLDRSSAFGKEYLRLFVNEIRLTGKRVEISGSYGALAQGIAQMKTGTDVVPAFIPVWLPDLGSNQGHTD